MIRLSDGRYESKNRKAKKVFIVKNGLIKEAFLESKGGDKIEYLFEINDSLLRDLTKAFKNGIIRRKNDVKCTK